MTLTPVQISTTIAILQARYDELLEKAIGYDDSDKSQSYASIKNEMVVINTTIRELKNA